MAIVCCSAAGIVLIYRTNLFILSLHVLEPGLSYSIISIALSIDGTKRMAAELTKEKHAAWEREKAACSREEAAKKLLF